MRNAVVGGLLGVLLGCAVLIACGGSGGGGTQVTVGQAILAAAHIDATPGTAVVTRSFNHAAPSGVTVTRLGVGAYEVDFGFDVSSRFFSLCVARHDNGALTRDRIATFDHHPVDPNSIIVHLWATSAASQTDTGHFYVSVY